VTGSSTDSSSELGGEPKPTDLQAEAARQMMSINARKVVLLGTAAFLVAFVVLLPFWSWLTDHGHRVWLWTALAGWILGGLALPLVRKHSGEGRLG
jgi:MFS family permease